MLSNSLSSLALAVSCLVPIITSYVVTSDAGTSLVRRDDAPVTVADGPLKANLATVEWAFAAIDSIPNNVLEAGDEATHKWVTEHGYGKVAKALIDLAKKEDNDPEPEPTPKPNESLVRRGWWEVTKCAGAIAAFVGSNLVSASKLLKVKKLLDDLGGIRKSAELIVKASNNEERLRIGGTALVALAGEILGTSLVANNC